jgi:hypothetical protein
MTIATKREQTQPSSRIHAGADRTARWVAVVATIFSVSAYAYFANRGMALGYEDSISHLQIAARVLNSPTAGFAQLGGVWLPLPHLLMLPLVWIDPLYYSGFAGSAVSMMSFVVATVYIYKTTFGLTRSRTAAVAGTLVFAVNPNVLYMQSTPMTELLLFAAIAAVTYYAQKWIQAEDHAQGYPYLFAAALAAFIGCLTRYEAWSITAVTAVVILYAGRRKYGARAAEGIVLSYLFLAGAGAGLWMGWNWLIFGNPLNFQNGKYAKPSLWVSEGEKAVGHPLIAAKTYWYAVVDNLGPVLVSAMLVGAVVLVVRRRNLDILPTLSLLTMAPFFVAAVAVGQRPLHVAQISGDVYNVRFGLLMVLPTAVLVGYLVSLLPLTARQVGIGLVVLATLMPLVPYRPTAIVTAQEGSTAHAGRSSLATSEFLRTHFDGGVVLIESFGNESILFHARVPLTNNVYEGSYQMWDPALSSPPGQLIRWIIMRGGSSPDETYRELHGSSKLDEYNEVFSNGLYSVYRRKA